MSELRPEDLTQEERAIVDHEAARFHRDWTGEARYKTAFEICKSFILARRALFAPAKEEGRVECPNCRQRVGPGWDHEVHDEQFTCKPAQPEPVAAEMPEAVRNAIVRMRWIADHNCGPYYQEWGRPVREAADALESFWRTHAAQRSRELSTARLRGNLEALACGQKVVDEVISAQPAKVRMTEELETILRFAYECADEYGQIRTKITAVRAQAEQAGVRLPKVREALVYLQKAIAAANDGWAGAWASLRSSTTREQIAAALAELDAAEGKVTG